MTMASTEQPPPGQDRRFQVRADEPVELLQLTGLPDEHVLVTWSSSSVACTGAARTEP
jgi:hypothetical protein